MLPPDDDTTMTIEQRRRWDLTRLAFTLRMRYGATPEDLIADIWDGIAIADEWRGKHDRARAMLDERKSPLDDGGGD